jgi:3'-5' exonuclease
MTVPRSYLVIDIETIIDPGLPMPVKAESSSALPPAPFHQVVAIGALWMDADYKPIKLGVVGENKSEAQVLQDFVRFVEERRPDLVTYNGRGFDLPVIVARCLRHGISFRHYFQAKDVRYRFSAQGHLDLMDYMTDHGATRAVPLDTLAKLIGLPGKVGVDGKDVGPLVHAGRLDEVNAYCLCDVVQTAGLFLRVQLLRGVIDRDGYREAMGALVGLMEEDVRLRPVFEGIKRDELLLT